MLAAPRGHEDNRLHPPWSIWKKTRVRREKIMSPRLAWQSALILLLIAGESLVAGGKKSAPQDPADQLVPAKKAEPVVVHKLADAEAQEFDWGWIRWFVNAKVEPGAPMTFGMVYIQPNQSNPFHIHPNCDEYVHVLEGSCVKFRLTRPNPYPSSPV